jgi:hypothetical protein
MKRAILILYIVGVFATLAFTAAVPVPQSPGQPEWIIPTLKITTAVFWPVFLVRAQF